MNWSIKAQSLPLHSSFWTSKQVKCRLNTMKCNNLEFGHSRCTVVNTRENSKPLCLSGGMRYCHPFFLLQNRLRSAPFAHWGTTLSKLLSALENFFLKEKRKRVATFLFYSQSTGCSLKKSINCDEFESAIVVRQQGNVVPAVFEMQSQTTDTGWVCWLPQAAQQKTRSYFSFTRCPPAKGSGGVTGNDINAICSIIDTHDPQCVPMCLHEPTFRLKTIFC